MAGAALALALMAGAPNAAKLAAFEAHLAAQDSATAALARWCASHALANPAQIRATPVAGDDALPPPDLDDLLQLGETEAGYRHVRLSCGTRNLSEAHNWYAPQRLTAQMNHLLATTDTPFGSVAAALNFRRERLASQRGAGAGCPKTTILTQRALLRLPDGAPLALLVECYGPENLAG